MLALPAYHVLAPTVLLDQDTAFGARFLKEQSVKGAELLRIERENFFNSFYDLFIPREIRKLTPLLAALRAFERVCARALRYYPIVGAVCVRALPYVLTVVGIVRHCCLGNIFECVFGRNQLHFPHF